MHAQIREVSAERWGDLLAVLGEDGGYESCWCMFWRLTNQEIHARSAADKRAALRNMVSSGQPVGVLLYHDDVPVGWCQVAPRSGFRRLFHTRGLDLQDTADSSVWSVVCVYVTRTARRTGAAGKLVRGAADYAARRGASFVEAYPVVNSGNCHKSRLSSGTVRMFSEAGFAVAAPAAGTRMLMRRPVQAADGD